MWLGALYLQLAVVECETTNKTNKSDLSWDCHIPQRETSNNATMVS